jgi:hypothetical protein
MPYLILQSIKSFEYKFKQSVEIIGTWGGNKHVGVPVEQKKKEAVHKLRNLEYFKETKPHRR